MDKDKAVSLDILEIHFYHVYPVGNQSGYKWYIQSSRIGGFFLQYRIVREPESVEDEADSNGSSTISPRTGLGSKADFLKAFPQYTEYDYDHRISIVKRAIMCSDMSRIEWKKDKKSGETSTNTTKNKSVKGQRAAIADCSSAESFFNFLTQQ